MMRSAVAAGLLAALGWSQQQPYPGQYPPGTYPQQGPGMGIPGITLPKRKTREEKEAEGKVIVKLASVDGRLKRLTPKELLLETRKNAVLRFRLTAKSRFLKKSGETIRDSLLNPGDRLSVQVDPGDEETAVAITFVEAGGQGDRAAADRPVDESVLRAPKTADFGRARDVELTAEDSDIPAGPVEFKNGALNGIDKEILGWAREGAMQFATSLPDFVATENIERSFTPRPDGAEWRPIDTMTVELAHVRGRETYRNLMIDGRVSRKPIEEVATLSMADAAAAIEGLLTGDETRVRYQRRPGFVNLAGRAAWVLDFAVAAADSQWVLTAPDKREHRTAYTGTLWVDQEKRRVSRIERKAVDVPAEFPMGGAESNFSYGWVRIGNDSHLVATGGATMNCVAGGGSCTRVAVEMKDYRKYAPDAKVNFFR